MIKILAIIGIIGGLLCAIADCLLDLKGPDNRKLGKMGIIDSKWETMPHFRFVWSDILAMFAVPMYTCGFIALMLQLQKINEKLSLGLTIIFLCGAMGGFMIHSFFCLNPTIYHTIINTIHISSYCSCNYCYDINNKWHTCTSVVVCNM